MAVYVITTDRKGWDWEVDQIVEGADIAKREVRDLKAMDCDNVKAHKFDTWEEADKFAEYVADYYD